MLSVAEILKPQGVKGELKVRPLTDSADMLLQLTAVSICGVSYKVEHIRMAGDFAFVKLAKVDDRNAAELLRGKPIEVSRDAAPKLPDGKFYIDDVVGLNVVDEQGNVLGVLDEILQYGSADVYSVNAEKPFSFPALKLVVKEINIGGKYVAVDTKELEKVAVYED